MFDDFWAGYNYGQQKPTDEGFGGVTTGMREFFPYAHPKPIPTKSVSQQKPAMYDKSKLIKMRGPSGENGELYANGKMYILYTNGKWQMRTFPSRPYGINYMQKKGWVLV